MNPSFLKLALQLSLPTKKILLYEYVGMHAYIIYVEYVFMRGNRYVGHKIHE
jgi:hypothetical protein